MNNTITIEQLISKADYIAECGNNRKVFFELFVDEDYAVIAIDESENEIVFHLHDKLIIKDGLIVFNNKYYEAFIETKVKF